MKNKEINLLPDQSLGEKILKKGFWLYFFSYIAAPCGYIIKVTLSNSLSVGEIGILYSIISFISLLSAYNGLGLTESLLYFLPKYYIKKQWDHITTSILMSLGVQLITSLGIIVLLFFGADWLAINYFHSSKAVEILKYFCIYFLGINLFQIISSIFLSFQDTFNIKLIEFIRIFSILGFTLFFFIFGIGTLFIYSLSRIAGLFLALIVGFVIFTKKYNKILLKGKIVNDSSFLKKYWKYSLRTFLALNVAVLMGQIDQQMIIVMLNPESAGYYTNYLSIMEIVLILITPIIALVFPLFTEMLSKKNYIDIGKLQKLLYTYLTFFSLSLSAFLIALGPEIATILFGNKFLLSGQLIQFGGVFFVFPILLNINFQILAAIGKIKEKAKILGIAVLSNFLLNLVLLKLFGLRGAILGTITAWFIMFILSYNLINKIFKIKFDVKFLIKNVVIFLILILLILEIKNNFIVINDIYRYKNFLYLVVFGMGYYGIIVLLNLSKIRVIKNIILDIIHKK